jgi:hypothetical protein
MGEINEALGLGDKFVIDGKEYRAHIATLEELLDLGEKTEGLFLGEKGFYINFIKLQDEIDYTQRDARVQRLLGLLQMIFPDAPVESIKKLNRKEMVNAIDYFLVG